LSKREDAIGVLESFVQVMRRPEESLALLPGQSESQFPGLAGGGGVESGGGFVEKDQGAILGQGGGDVGALAFAAGELVETAMALVFQVESGDGSIDRLAMAVIPGMAGKHEEFLDREGQGFWALRHPGDEAGPILPSDAIEILTCKGACTAAGELPEETAQQAALAGAVGAEKGRQSPGSKIKIDPVKNLK